MFAALLLGSCGGGDKAAPSTPSVVAATTPAPAVTPAPTPRPPTATGRACDAIRGSGAPSGCAKSSESRFFNKVRDAIGLALVASYRDPASGQSVPVVEDGDIVAASEYIRIVIEALDSQGICAAYDGEEIYVSDGGGFNENYDIVSADGRSYLNHVVTCRPALPVPNPPPGPGGQRDADCKLPPSAAYWCARSGAELDGEVYGAQDELIAEDRARSSAQIFDFSSKGSNDAYAFKIVNEPNYIAGMLRKLKARGLCAAYDGDEFNVKRTNLFSENYDLTKADLFAIRIYGATCRDAQY